MQVGIIGVGLIGGSMAVDLKNRGFAIVLSGLKRMLCMLRLRRNWDWSTKSSVMKNVLL